MAQSLSLSNSSISELSNKENVLDLSVEEVFQSFSSSSGALSSSLKASRPSSLSSFGDLVSSSHKVPSQEVKVKLPNGEEVVLGEWSGWSQSVARVPVRLHVSNLPFRYRLVSLQLTSFTLPSVREHNLVQLFSRVGSVLEAEVIYNDRGSKGFGFITMASREDASNALARLHRTVVEGRLIQVNYATPKKVATPRKVGQVERARVSPRDLVEAEIKLARAQLQVDMMRMELSVFRSDSC